MPSTPSIARLLPVSQRWLALLFLVAVVSLGCEKREEISHYTVPKPLPIEPPASKLSGDQLPEGHPPLEIPSTGDGRKGVAPVPTGEPTDRMLGAIIPATPQGWFFKLSGPKDAVTAQEPAFMALIKTLHFAADGKPEWTLPEGWQTRPGNQFRFATLEIPGAGKPLEVTVTALPNAGGDDANYILQNVNRWRGQLKLPPTTTEQLATEATVVKVDALSATIVNLLGTAAPTGMGGGPFSGARNGN